MPSPSRKITFRRFLVALLLCPVAVSLPIPCPTATQERPSQTIEETCTAFAFAQDGRIAYSVRRIYSSRRIDYQRDDIWILYTDGKRKKIVNGERLVQGGGDVYSYAVQSIRWSPDGTRLSVTLATSVMISARGETRDSDTTLMLDDNGKEIKVVKGDSVIPNAIDGVWLADNATVVYLLEAVKPKLLFRVGLTRPADGYGGPVLDAHVFSTVAWNVKQGIGVAVERNQSLSGPARLVLIDPVKETVHELATLEGISGPLALSPSGTRVAYFRDPETLEVRDLAHPELVGRTRVAYGILQWAADERRLLLKRGVERRASSALVWVPAPQPGPATPSARITDAEIQPALHDEIFRDFQLSPDGRQVAVIEPGKRNLLIYPVQ
jgi:dipeptidyl aminopeptidase/acylaminoacyl peptidase